MRYYNPDTRTEALSGIHDLAGTTEKDAMPAASQEWFIRAPAEGMQWQNDPTNTYPVEVAIPEPTAEELTDIERAWVRAELLRTDPAVLPDSPYTPEELVLIKAYRAALRNPTRTTTPGFPAVSWRPVFPAGIRQPGE